MRSPVVLSVLFLAALIGASALLWRQHRESKRLERETAVFREQLDIVAKEQLRLARLQESRKRQWRNLDRRLAELRSALKARESEASDPALPDVEELWEAIADIENRVQELQPAATDPAEIWHGAQPNSAPSWGVEQFFGEPNTLVNADAQTAWATAYPDLGIEWLEADFEASIVPDAILVRESFNPGAVVEIQAIDAQGRYHTVWTGVDPTEASPGEFRVPYPLSFPIETVRVTLDTSAVEGWNEIDAVGLVKGDRTYWAVDGAASSSYAERMAGR